MRTRTTITDSFFSFDKALEFVYVQTSNEDPVNVEILEINGAYRVGITYEGTINSTEAGVREAFDVAGVQDPS